MQERLETLKVKRLLPILFFFLVGIVFVVGPVKSSENTPAEAFLLLQNRAISGDPESQWLLASVYRYGTYSGVGIDKKKSVEWMKRAAEGGHTGAQHDLAHYYVMGFGVVKDEKKAFEWTKRAAERGHRYAQFNLADFYHRGFGIDKNEEKAFEWYLKGAEGGNPKAALVVGLWYWNGTGVTKNDSEAYKWLEISAVGENSEAQYLVGWTYEKGNLGVQENIVEACKWYLKAALQDHELGMFHTARCLYFDWEGIEKDVQEGFNWFRRAVEQGHPGSALMVGIAYKQGEVVPKNDVWQYAYLSIAAALGSENGKTLLEFLEDEISEVARQQGQEKAAVMWAKIEANRND